MKKLAKVEFRYERPGILTVSMKKKRRELKEGRTCIYTFGRAWTSEKSGAMRADVLMTGGLVQVFRGCSSGRGTQFQLERARPQTSAFRFGVLRPRTEL
jgi:hypothetical protein